MKKKRQVMVGGAIVSFIGIIIVLFGYDKYKSVESALSTMANGSPPGVAEATIGILIFVVGAFAAIHGFGQLPEEPKMQ